MKEEQTKLYIVYLPHTTFGIDISKGVCTKAAPIGKWRESKSLVDLACWVKNKNGSMYKSRINYEL